MNDDAEAAKVEVSVTIAGDSVSEGAVDAAVTQLIDAIKAESEGDAFRTSAYQRGFSKHTKIMF